MPASHGSKADIIANGYVLSSYLNSATASGQRDTAETTTFGSTSKSYIPGLRDTTMSAEGLFDGVANGIDEILWTSLNSQTPGLISYFPFGAGALGNVAYSMPFIQNSYEVNTEVGDVAQISAEFQAGQNGRYARGFVSHLLQAEAAPGNTTGLDNTVVSTANGGGLVVHITAANNLSVKLQDSADNVTFADVSSAIVVASGRASARVEVAGIIRRYTRVLWTGTGTFLAVTERY